MFFFYIEKNYKSESKAQTVYQLKLGSRNILNVSPLVNIEETPWIMSREGGQEGGNPGEIVAGGGSGKGGMRKFYVGGKRERNTKRNFFLVQRCVRILSKTRTQNIFDVFSVTSETSEQTSKPKFAIGSKNRPTSGEIWDGIMSCHLTIVSNINTKICSKFHKNQLLA